MALKIRTVMTYPLTGAVDFAITFEYLARKFVTVTLIGKDRKELVLNQDYRFTTKTQITTTRAWTAADGYDSIEIRRFTSATDRLVDFADGSILRAYDLNISQIQTLHVAEEARDLTAATIGVNNDGHLDARGRRIVNLANAVDDHDAVPLGQLKTMDKNSWQARNEALQFRNEAETFRNKAEGFKNESSTHATNAKQWRDEANEFRNEAEQFKNTSGQYAASAGSYAGNAKDSEDEARRIAASIRESGKFGYITSRSFEKGFNVTKWNEVLLWEEDGEYYRWGGILPKNVPAGSTPETSGGIGLGAWASVGDASLRSDLAKDDGYKLIGGLGVRHVDIAAEAGDDFEDGTIIIAKYGFETGDLAGGQFIYHSNRNLTPDGGIVINVGTVGQAVRYGLKRNIFPTPVSIQWYGAIPHSDDYDNAIAINAALASPYTTEVSVDDYYLVKTRVTMQSNKALVGRSPSWAYADSGFNMVGTIALSDNHTLGYLDPIVDCRYKRQTTLINIDIDGKGHDVTCLEYGRRLDDIADTQSYNNHVRMGCSLRAGRMGLRTDNAGLHKSFGEQITGCIEAGIYSANNLSDSTFVSLYVNEIGYHSGDDPSDLSAIVGVGIHLGPHSGVAFIGGKIEYTRIHIQCSGASYTRFSNMWLDVAKRAAVVFKGIPEGSGRNNFIDNCVITGGGYTDAANGAAVVVDGGYGPMDLTITGGNITAADENINPDATTAPTFGAKLAGVKVGNNPNGLVVINGTDMRKCSLSYTVYAYGNSRVIDNSISNLPNSLSGGSTVNGYLYDAGNGSRGYTLREAADDPTAASSGIPVGGYYLKEGNHVCIRKS